MEFRIACLLAPTVVLLCSLSFVRSKSTTKLYVIPDNNTGLCPTTNKSFCQTFNSYVDQAASYFLSDTILLFLPGNHFLNYTAKFGNISNIGLVTYTSSTRQQNTTVTCSPSTNTGLYFRNVTQLRIKNLTLTGCSHDVGKYRAAISVYGATNVTIMYVKVTRSLGYGLYTVNMFGQSHISHSVFSHNTQGGNAFLRYKHCSHTDTIHTSLLTISMSHFEHGVGKTEHLASGIGFFIWCTNINIEIDGVRTFNNTVQGYGIGGNMAVLVRNRTDLIKNKVVIKNCHIEAGNGHFGGGFYVSFEQVPSTLTNNSLTQEMVIEGNTFTSNHAASEGGGLYIIVHEVVGLLHPVGLINITNCHFDSNTLANKLTAGVALHINNHYIPGYAEHITPQYLVKVDGCNFTNSSVILNPNSDTQISTSSTVFVLQTQAGVYFSNCTFTFNRVTGLTVGRSNVIFSGEIIFEGNSGFDGGGMLLCDRSFMFLSPHTNVSFISNHANNTGGGIYIGGECLQSIPECFFQFSRSLLNESLKLLNTTSVILTNNTAGSAGSAIYGGSVDFCVILSPWMYTPHTIYGSHHFDKLFKITHRPHDLSYVTSDPYEVCFCSELPPPHHPKRNCSISYVEKHVYPGSTFTIVAVAVGQRNGTAPASIIALAQHPTYLSEGQVYQEVNVTCTTLKYTANTTVSSTEIKLLVDGPVLSAPPTLKIKHSSIHLRLKDCPIGFTLSTGVCDCSVRLRGKPGVECILDPFSHVRRSLYSWIGFHNSSQTNKSGIIYHRYCPLDYCKVDVVNIKASDSSFDQDDQCTYRRTGLLCGQCPSGLSAVFGSSKCHVCSDRFLSLLIAFTAAGIALVVFLNVSQLTVTSGAINGLIFYANVIQTHRSFLENLNPFFRVFIAWLNLDLGIEVCFYNGMDTFAKVFLQFAFPAYIIFLAFLIIFLSRRYYTVARLMGSSSVKVLATLFFLCYAKLLRIIISIFTATIIVYPDTSSDARWTEDGSIAFARGKHVFLMTVGLLAIGFSLPYTIIITFHQCIQRSKLTCCQWIHRLKPFLDAYGGIYKDKYRFWTGLLLFVRLFLFVAFALNVEQSSYINLMAILFVCLGVLSLGWVLGGVYRHWPLDALEVSFFLNLAIFSAASLNALQAKDATKQKLIISISVGLAFATFVLILLHRGKVAFKKIGQILKRSSMCAQENNALFTDILSPGSSLISQ